MDMGCLARIDRKGLAAFAVYPFAVDQSAIVQSGSAKQARTFWNMGSESLK
jgi:hypothetical protein